jgi:F420-0:gamma-glutamyl ligase
MAPAEAAKIDKLMQFVQNWSGGASGQILEQLEKYEKTLAIKRKITADDLAKLAEAVVSEFDRIIPAIYIYL